MNQNLAEYEKGNRIRLEIHTNRAQSVLPEFATTTAAARKRKSELKNAGYVAHLFAISPTGGLSPTK